MRCGSFFEIKKFCCCSSLRIGSFIIGYLGLIGNVLETAGGSAHLNYIQTLTVNNINITNNSTVANLTGLYTEYMAVAIAYHAVSIIFHVALVWGIHKARSEFILPWLVIKGFESVILIIVSIAATIIYIASPEVDIGTFFLLLAIFIVCICLTIYTYMCVYSHYLEIRSVPIPDTQDESIPPVYIRSFNDNKKENMTDITFNQNII